MPFFTKYRKFTVAIEWLLSGYCVAIEWLLGGYWSSACCTTSMPRYAHIESHRYIFVYGSGMAAHCKGRLGSPHKFPNVKGNRHPATWFFPIRHRHP